ncbi:GlcG/HbpS family heme-binding protein [Novosphingobium rosa]|uniref:GlcG/HbpS family heme-binding protein n=1 Tax=Novosphingobium rosa TaxID=76978 RepID=UPI00082C30EC|nr:heme-binding protein [Novosphingobium rosa]
MTCKLFALTALLAASTAQAAPSRPAAILRPPALSADLALHLAATARAACLSHGAQVAVAITDASGETRLLVASDGVSSIGVESARRKAMSAALVGFPTAGLVEAAKVAPTYTDLLKALHGDMLFMAGGLPLRVDGQLVGAIGVGGAANGEADEACAKAAADELANQH